MSPAQHIDWFNDNVEWFGSLSNDVLDVAVPACPGWSVENVLTHLAFGLGLAYPHALSIDPDTTADQAFRDVDWPSETPAGEHAMAAFRHTMAACLGAFRRTDPNQPCFTYDGAGVAGFWFRRAAIETTLHRMDVVDALGEHSQELATERAVDAIAESVEFTLPFAARMTASDIAAVRLVLSDADASTVALGAGNPVATVTGRGVDVLGALWGRNTTGVSVQGDTDAVAAWLGVIETAFAGR